MGYDDIGDEIVGIDKAAGRLPELIGRVEDNDDSFTIYKDGKPVAVIVSHDWHENAVAALNEYYRSHPG